MTLSVHRDFPRKMGQSRASSDMEKAHQRYSTSVVKASGLLVTTKFVDGNTAPYFEYAAQPTFALAEVVCCMTSWQGVAGTLFRENSLFLLRSSCGVPKLGARPSLLPVFSFSFLAPSFLFQRGQKCFCPQDPVSTCKPSLCSATREAATVRGPCTAMKSGPRSP